LLYKDRRYLYQRNRDEGGRGGAFDLKMGHPDRNQRLSTVGRKNVRFKRLRVAFL